MARITTPVIISNRLYLSGMLGSPHGPWLYGSSRFVIGVDVGDAAYLFDGVPCTIEIWKSADGGHTWAECDEPNHLTSWPGASGADIGGTTSFFTGSFWAIRFGDTIYVSYPKTGTRETAIASFNLATETWGAEIAGGPTQGYVEAAFPSSDPAFVGECVLGKRSDGSFIVAYVGTDAFQKYVIYSGGAWQTPVTVLPYTLDTSVEDVERVVSLRSGVLDDSDRFHLFFGVLLTDPDTFVVTQYNAHRSVLSDGSLGTIQDISPPPGLLPFVSGLTVGLCKSYCVGNELLLPITVSTIEDNPDPDGPLHYFLHHSRVLRATSADDPTWEFQDPGTILYAEGSVDDDPQAAVNIGGQWRLIYAIHYRSDVRPAIPSDPPPTISPLKSNTDYGDWLEKRESGGVWSTWTRLYGTEEWNINEGGNAAKPNVEAIGGGYGIVLLREPGRNHTTPFPADNQVHLYYMEFTNTLGNYVDSASSTAFCM